jgi:uncharacterized protein YjiS (DUF1127 family)
LNVRISGHGFVQCKICIAAMQQRLFNIEPLVLICCWQTNTRLNESSMNLIRNYRNWRRYRDTVNELSRLSNRELNDLGINRADITVVANKSL